MIRYSTKTVKASYTKQSGVSLIGLMIGLLVSMIAILGTLSLYKSLTQTSVDATFDSKHNGNASILLSRISEELQSAGYGMPAPPPVHLVVTVGEIRWRQADSIGSARVFCKRIVEAVTTDNPDMLNGVNLGIPANTAARIIVMQSLDSMNNMSCTAAADLATIADAQWNAGVWTMLNISVLNRLNQEFDAVELADTGFINFVDLGVTLCSPYGMTPAQNYRGIRIQYPSSQDINAAAENDSANIARTLNHQVCISNPV